METFHASADGKTVFVEAGGKVEVKAGATLEVAGVEINDSTLAVNDLDASADELNLLEGIPGGVSFSAAPGAADICEVTVQVLDAAGEPLAGIFDFEIWLSGAATGAGLTGTTASGAVAVKSASGYDLAALVAKKLIRAQTLADGSYILSIEASAKTGYYVAVRLLGSPAVRAVSAQLQTADYGSGS